MHTALGADYGRTQDSLDERPDTRSVPAIEGYGTGVHAPYASDLDSSKVEVHPRLTHSDPQFRYNELGNRPFSKDVEGTDTTADAGWKKTVETILRELRY